MEAGLLLLFLSRARWAGLQYSCLTLWWPSSEEDKTSSDTQIFLWCVTCKTSVLLRQALQKLSAVG